MTNTANQLTAHERILYGALMIARHNLPDAPISRMTAASAVHYIAEAFGGYGEAEMMRIIECIEKQEAAIKVGK